MADLATNMIFVNLDHHCFGPFVFLFVIRSCKEKNWRTHSCMQIGWFQTKRCRSSMSERFLIKMLILVVNSSKRHAMICCQWIHLQQRPRSSSLWNSSRDVAGRFLKIGSEFFVSQPLMAYLTDCRCRWTWCLKRVAQLSLTQMFYRHWATVSISVCAMAVHIFIIFRRIMSDRFGQLRLPPGAASQPLDPEGHWAAYVKWLHRTGLLTVCHLHF